VCWPPGGEGPGRRPGRGGGWRSGGDRPWHQARSVGAAPRMGRLARGPVGDAWLRLAPGPPGASRCSGAANRCLRPAAAPVGWV
jgi:hypothetical protein